MKMHRLFSILDLLRAARYPLSAEVLAQRMNVSVRTIYRDMASLSVLGAPVHGEPGLGYQLEKGFFLPPLKFDPDEAEAIMLGLKLVMARNSDCLRDAAERVSGKIAEAMGDKRDAFLDLPFQAVTRTRPEDTMAERWEEQLREMIRKRMIAQLAYTDLSGKESRRLVWPLGLTVFDEAWLLTAWCETRCDFRNFRLDRISALYSTGARFLNQKGRRMQDYLSGLQAPVCPLVSQKGTCS